jgi:hypothetical protein
MMDSTPNLLLPYIMPSQAQKFVPHNAALLALDALVMLSVKSRTETAPPVAAAEGDRYVVAAAATGAWVGQSGRIAALQAGAWNFFTPVEGWLCWCEAEQALLCFTTGDWTPVSPGAGGMQNVPFVGVNATADATNRLSVAADATLFSHAGADHRLVVNKHGETDAGSLLFQDGFSGRAEFGLCGDDDWHVKVSADGTAWTEAMAASAATAKARFPHNHTLESYALNLDRDGGRAAGSDAAGNTVGAFAWPAYLSLNNGATVAAWAKFIYNNTDYGGTGGALDGKVKDLIDLIDQIRDPDYRRYSVEWRWSRPGRARPALR